MQGMASREEIPEELTGARDQHLLSADNHDFLAKKQLLGNNGCQSTQKVTFAVNNHRAGHSIDALK